MTYEEEINLSVRLSNLKERVFKLYNLCDYQNRSIWVRELKRLVGACDVTKLKDIPLKVVPLAEQFIDRVVKDYGLPEV